ncbi:MAG: hypothetical protein P8N43_09185, partial [Alphaproteobacteria bacterium]|nr:hypothetical protein [Alphaproteobacteria bacterium]
QVFANPAVMTNRVNCFLAIDTELGGETSFDESEEIETFSMPATEVYRALLDGRLSVQALHLASLYMAAAFVRASKDPALEPIRDAIAGAYEKD